MNYQVIWIIFNCVNTLNIIVMIITNMFIVISSLNAKFYVTIICSTRLIRKVSYFNIKITILVSKGWGK